MVADKLGKRFYGEILIRASLQNLAIMVSIMRRLVPVGTENVKSPPISILDPKEECLKCFTKTDGKIKI